MRNIGDNSFQPSIRLRKRNEFLRLKNAPNAFVGRGILVLWQNNGSETARLGITVSKKIGCAVKRNRIKRYIRNIFRQNNYKLSAVDINVIARNGSATMAYSNMQHEILKAFEHINRLLCSNVLHS